MDAVLGIHFGSELVWEVQSAERGSGLVMSSWG